MIEDEEEEQFDDMADGEVEFGEWCAAIEESLKQRLPTEAPHMQLVAFRDYEDVEFKRTSDGRTFYLGYDLTERYYPPGYTVDGEKTYHEEMSAADYADALIEALLEEEEEFPIPDADEKRKARNKRKKAKKQKKS